MAKKTFYSVLGLPASATGLEIRAAYQSLITHVQAGEIAPDQAAAIDEAYATLGSPVHRLQYDLQLTAPPLPEREPANELAGATPVRVDPRRRRRTDIAVAATPLPQRQPLTLPRWRWDAMLLMDPRWPVAAMAVVVVAGIAMITMLSHAGGAPRATTTNFAQPQASPAVIAASVPAASSDLAVATVGAATPDTVVSPSAPESTPDVSVQPAPVRAPSPGVLARLDGAAQVRAPAGGSLTDIPARVAPAAFIPQPVAPQEASSPLASLQTAQLQAAALPEPAPNIAQASSTLGPTIAALEQFLPSGSNAAFQRRVASATLAGHLTGQYCHDPSGGEVFVPGGAPVPTNLRCQG